MTLLRRPLKSILCLILLLGCSTSPTEEQPRLTLEDFPGWYELTATFRDPGDGTASWQSWLSLEDSTWVVADGKGVGGDVITLCWSIDYQVESATAEKLTLLVDWSWVEVDGIVAIGKQRLTLHLDGAVEGEEIPGAIRWDATLEPADAPEACPEPGPQEFTPAGPVPGSWGMHPARSLDGEWFVTAPTPGVTEHLLVFPARGGTPTRVETGMPVGRSDWSPDGSRVVFEGFDTEGSGPNLWTIARDGSDLTQLTDAGSDWYPAWSPDGARIAFASRRLGEFGIWMVGASGGQPNRLTADPADDWGPDWSPDGNLVFSSARSGTPSLWIVDFGTWPPHQLTTVPSDGAAWSPDGKEIAFTSNGAILAVPAGGGEPREIYRSRSFFPADPTWSLDGKQISFFAQRWVRTVWTVPVAP